MNIVARTFLKIRKGFLNIIGVIITFIYNAIFSRFVSGWAYKGMVTIMDKQLSRIDSVLDVGVGTGMSLYKVVDKFGKNTEITGIDLSEFYVQQAKKLFKNHQNVQIIRQDFYKFLPNRKYDLIILGFSFMLLPSPQKALLRTIQMLAPKGRIVFLLTMHKNKSWLMDKIKPWFKYITTIDFGRMTYQDQLLGLLDEFNLKIVQKARLGDQLYSNQPLFHFFNVWIFETEYVKPILLPTE